MWLSSSGLQSRRWRRVQSGAEVTDVAEEPPMRSRRRGARHEEPETTVANVRRVNQSKSHPLKISK
eukprot:scaffold122711_cov69-Phaeocystis_antarctica.AAC.2